MNVNADSLRAFEWFYGDSARETCWAVERTAIHEPLSPCLFSISQILRMLRFSASDVRPNQRRVGGYPLIWKQHPTAIRQPHINDKPATLRTPSLRWRAETDPHCGFPAQTQSHPAVPTSGFSLSLFTSTSCHMSAAEAHGEYTEIAPDAGIFVHYMRGDCRSSRKGLSARSDRLVWQNCRIGVVTPTASDSARRLLGLPRGHTSGIAGVAALGSHFVSGGCVEATLQLSSWS